MKRLMSFIVIQLLLVASAFAGGQQGELELIPQNCISVEHAQLVAFKAALDELRICKSEQEYYDGDCEITSEELLKRILNIRWVNKNGFYKSGIIQSYYCAPGAECWWGYAINCEGKIGKWSGGED